MIRKQVRKYVRFIRLAHLPVREVKRKGIIGGRTMLTRTFSPNISHPTIILEMKGGFSKECIERILTLA